MKECPRVGDQLELGLPGLVDLARQPWGGRSPRGLTRVALSTIFKAQAAKERSVSWRDVNQFDLWLPMKRAPAKYAGAPLLLPLSALGGQRNPNHG